MKKYAVASILAGVAILAAYAPDYSQFNQPLTKDQEILHALNRLTFGPRPGDVEAVQKMGLKKWIDQQLHPEKIAENPAVMYQDVPKNIRRMATYELHARGIHYLMIADRNEGAEDVAEDPESWGLKLLGHTEGERLYQTIW